MATSIHQLDAMPESEAADVLRACCGASRWVDHMVARRPFRSADALFSAADEIWDSCSASDWMEAFGHHPRIGADHPAPSQGERAAAWSAGEQSAAKAASVTVQEELAEVNREYEERFGYTYIVCATGKTADEMLASAQSRMKNDPDKELQVAAEEQRMITRIRLQKLLGSDA